MGRVELFKQSSFLQFEFEGKGFLKHMVRKFVETLVDVGKKIPCKTSENHSRSPRPRVSRPHHPAQRSLPYKGGVLGERNCLDF